MILNIGSIIRTPGGLCYNSDRQPYFPNFWCSWPGYDSWYGTFWMVSWWFLNLMLGETILIRWCASVAQIGAISVVYSSEDHFCSFFFSFLVAVSMIRAQHLWTVVPILQEQWQVVLWAESSESVPWTVCFRGLPEFITLGPGCLPFSHSVSAKWDCQIWSFMMPASVDALWF